jgi:exopolysaccharide biosynthesis WecB/TagA/CpsF family protein
MSTSGIAPVRPPVRHAAPAPAGAGSPLPSVGIGRDRRLHVNTASATALLAEVERRLTDGRGFTVATLNLDHLVKLRRDAAFRDAYAATSLVVADGNPVVWLTRLQGLGVGLVPGSELVEPLCAMAARLGVPVAMIGATQVALDAAAARLEARHPGLRVVLRHAPPFGYDPDGEAAAEDIRRIGGSGARLCFVALGAPKQERLAVRAARALPGCGFVSVGAGLDFLAGTQSRAPVWMRRLSMEWIWRLLHDPRRLAGRYAACIAILPLLVVDSLRVRFDGA